MKVVLFANADWYLYNFRRSLALRLQGSGHDVLLVSPEGGYAARLSSLGLRWQRLVMERQSLNPLRELGVLWRFFRLLRAERPDVMHAFTLKSVIYGALAAKAAGVPARVCSIEGMGYVYTSKERKARLLQPFVNRLLSLVLSGDKVRVVVLNQDDAAQLADSGLVDSSRIRLVRGSGVDSVQFHSGGERMPTARVRVLLSARLLWDKGVAEYAQAARLLHERGTQVDLLLAGEPDAGNPAAVPESTVRAWAEEGLVQWLGHVDDMPGLLRGVDIVALPSYREGLPRSLTEAAASGCALITTDMPGCREVVTHEVDGLLIPVRDAAALADAIERLVADVDLRKRLAHAARDKVLAVFDERIVYEHTLQIYRELGGRW